MLSPKLFTLPLPILAGLASQEVIPRMPNAGQGPEWLVGASAAAFTILWLLNTIGKLPGGTVERREIGFHDGDRSHLEDIHRTVMREDQSGPGWPILFNSPQEMRAFRDGLVGVGDLIRMLKEDREELKNERAQLELRITRMEEIIRRQDTALRAMGRDSG
jgi:hypothetical protein